MIYRSVACGKGSRCHGNPKPGLERGGQRRGACAHINQGRPNALPHAHAHTHMHTHVGSDRDYERDSVQGPTYKVMESRAGDIRGRAALTGVNKITVDAAGQENDYTNTARGDKQIIIQRCVSEHEPRIHG